MGDQEVEAGALQVDPQALEQRARTAGRGGAAGMQERMHDSHGSFQSTLALLLCLWLQVLATVEVRERQLVDGEEAAGRRWAQEWAEG